ncbi:MAG: response regulator [Pseudomonadota bacterium]
MFRILLIEDNADHAILASAALSEHGAHIQVECRDSADSAWIHLQDARNGDALRPNLILLDINMPGMDGFTLLRRIKSDPKLRLIPTIMLSSSANQSDIMRALSDHANSYVTKSTDFTRWEAALHAICDYWSTHDRACNLEEV